MPSTLHTSSSAHPMYTPKPAHPMYRSRSHSAKSSAGHDRTNTTTDPGAIPPLPHLPRSRTPGPKADGTYSSSTKERENLGTNSNTRAKATDPLRRSRTPTPTSSSWTSTPSHGYNYTHSHSNKTPPVHTHILFDDETGPWAQTVNTYTWVLEQEYKEMMRRREQERSGFRFSPSKGAKVETQYFGARNDWKPYDEVPYELDPSLDPSKWEQAAHEIDMQARMWMLQEEARRMAALREAEQTRIVQEEVRRIQERIMQKREMERQRLLDERRKAQEANRDRERRIRARIERATADAWKVYDARWASIGAITATQPLSFASIPWPVLESPSSPASLTLARISTFLLSNAHSQGQSARERIKEALRRWHPDRFGRLLHRVVEVDKAAVEEGVGIVARCLNEMLSRQGQQEPSSRSH